MRLRPRRTGRRVPDSVIGALLALVASRPAAGSYAALPPVPPVAPVRRPSEGPSGELPEVSPLPPVPAVRDPWRQPVGAAANRSYAAELDTAIACLPCYRAHASTAAAAGERAQQAMGSGDIQGAKAEALRAAAEVMAFHLYDFTEERKQATPPETLAVIEETRPALVEAAKAAPAVPPVTMAAWISVDEAARFARSEGATGADGEQVAMRLRPTLRWMDETERLVLAPERTAALAPGERERMRRAADLVRQARHALVDGQGLTMDPDRLEAAAAHLSAATLAMAPDPTPEDVARLQRATADAAERLDDHLLEQMRSGVLTA